jgi:fibro-slime domain-containing protein
VFEPEALLEGRRGRDTVVTMAKRSLVVFASAALLVVGCGSESNEPVQGGTSPNTPVGPGNPPGSPDGLNPPSDSDLIEAPMTPASPTSPSGTVENPEDCDSILEVTYRDFNEQHPDFEGPFLGDEVRLQLVQARLDTEGKPVFRDSIGCPWSQQDPTQCADWKPDKKVIESKETFDQWYRTVEGVNIEFEKKLPLTETPPGSGVFVFESNEFFPLSPDEGFGPTPVNGGQGRNYLFTTEIHLTFTYVAGQTFKFRGDDDLWIFINDRLALDLGSMHNPAEGVIDFDKQAAALGITPGSSYRMDVFHAERHTQVSSFRIETNISCFKPAPPRPRIL